MKDYPYPLRLFLKGYRTRRFLEDHYSREARRKVDFATILRDLMEKDAERIKREAM